MRVVIETILGCLLVTTGILSATDVNNLQKGNEGMMNFNTQLDPVDVPIWEVGDRWIFKVGRINADFQSDNLSMQLETERYNVTFEVVGVYDEFYNATIESITPCKFVLLVNFGDGFINITGDFLRDTKGVIIINKSNIGINEAHFHVYGKSDVTIWDQPYFKWWPFKIGPIKGIRGHNYLDINFTHTFAMLNFPLDVGSIYPLPENNFSVAGRVKSFFLKTVSWINDCIREKGGPWRPGPKNLSNLIAELLPPDDPVLRIEKVLQKLNLSNTFQMIKIPGAFFCNGIELVTVPGGTYEAYNISIIGGLANIYYAPDAGNFIKFSGNFQNIFPSLREMDIVLMETNYS
jgi:hypothetical protein